MSDYGQDGLYSGPDFSDDKVTFRTEVLEVVSSIREELDDHRQAINENSEETESNFEFLVEVARKVDALAERIDSLALSLSKEKDSRPAFEIKSLSAREKKVFSGLYRITEDFPEVSYVQLAALVGVPEEHVKYGITGMIEKGVPVKKRYVGRVVKISLDAEFRQEQAKGNLVRLDHPLTAWL